MKNKIARTLVMTAVAAVFAAVVGCSDGVTPPMPPKDFAESCSAILTGYKIGDDPANAKAGEVAITAGEGVVVQWSVSTLTSATLSSDPEKVIGIPIVLSITDKKIDDKTTLKVAEGSQEFRALSEDVIFKVSAKNEETGKEASPCDATLTVKTSPVAEKLAVNSFNTKTSDVTVGSTTEICWNVSPSTATVEIKDGQKNPLVPVAPVMPTEPIAESALVATGKAAVVDDTTGEAEAGEVEESTVSFPAVGCTSVSPKEDTTYTLTATTLDGQSTEATASVKVVPVQLSVKFTANGSDALILTTAGDVKIAWEVTPADATVTIDNGIGTVAASGEQTVSVKENSVYTLTASYGEQVVVEQVQINIQQGLVGGAAKGLNATLTANTTDVFAGEEVVLSWTVAMSDGSAVSSTPTAAIDGPSGRLPVTATGTSVALIPTASGAYSVEVTADGAVAKSNTININVKNWEMRKMGISTRAIEPVASGHAVLVGSSKIDASNGGYGLKFGRIVGNKTWEDLIIDLKAAFTLFDAGYDASKYLPEMGPVSINAFAIDSANGRAYAGGVGFMVFSDDNGDSWTAIDAFTTTVKGKTEFATCRGAVQKNASTEYKILQNVHQVCDVAVDASAVILATDFGVMYNNTIDARIAGRAKENDWKMSKGLENVIADVVAVYGGKVFAGTVNGIYVSTDGGATFSDSNGGDLGSGSSIYAIAFDSANKKIYAGGPSGLFESALGDAASWKRVALDGGTVQSIVVDDDGTVYAGTDTGVFIKRNCCDKWTNISASIEGAVYGLTIGKVGGVSSVYAASASGIYNAVGTAATIVAPQTPVVEPTTPAPEATSAMKALVK